MTTIGKIRQYFSNQRRDAIITSRDLLDFAPIRDTIDNAVFRLTQAGEIVRVARGVFIRPDRGRLPTVLEVAKAKAAAFSRTLITHPRDAANELGLSDESVPETEVFFATDGRTSSFRYQNFTIHFKGTSRRKMVLGDSHVGKAIRALCYLGAGRLTWRAIDLATCRLSKTEKEELGSLRRLMPAWLSDVLCNWFKPVMSYPANGHDSIVRESENVYQISGTEGSYSGGVLGATIGTGVPRPQRSCPGFSSYSTCRTAS